MKPDEKTLLVSLHARLDAVFSPSRGPDWQSNAARNKGLLQGRWRRGLALPWTSGGQASDRKAGERTARALAETGFLAADRPHGKSTGFRLSPAGLAVAARLAAGYCIGDPEVKALHKRLVKLDAERDDGRGCAEWLFDDAIGKEWATANTKEGRRAWIGVESKMLPLLVYGHATVNSDIEGRAFYRPGAPLPAKLPKAPAVDAEDACVDRWFEEHREFRKWLSMTAGMEPAGEIVIPCSCSWMPRRTWNPASSAKSRCR